MAIFKRGKFYWYELKFQGQHIRERSSPYPFAHFLTGRGPSTLQVRARIGFGTSSRARHMRPRSTLISRELALGTGPDIHRYLNAGGTEPPSVLFKELLRASAAV